MNKKELFNILVSIFLLLILLNGTATAQTCVRNDDCDDNNPCTFDVCKTFPSVCVHTPVANNIDCRDNLYCNGTIDYCKDGICIHSGNPCSEGTICNETTDTCDPIVSSTTTTFLTTTTIQVTTSTSTSTSTITTTITGSTTTTFKTTTPTTSAVGVTTTSTASTSVVVSSTTTSSVQTTTSVPPITTTTSIKPCPFTAIAGNELDKLNLLRGFRDRVFMNTEAGREYIILFYKHSSELTLIMLINPSIAAQFKDVLNTLLPKVESALEGNEIDITDMEMDNIILLLEALTGEASIDLQTTIQKIKDDLTQERILNILGIKIKATDK